MRRRCANAGWVRSLSLGGRCSARRCRQNALRGSAAARVSAHAVAGSSAAAAGAATWVSAGPRRVGTLQVPQGWRGTERTWPALLRSSSGSCCVRRPEEGISAARPEAGAAAEKISHGLRGHVGRQGDERRHKVPRRDGDVGAAQREAGQAGVRSPRGGRGRGTDCGRRGGEVDAQGWEGHRAAGHGGAQRRRPGVRQQSGCGQRPGVLGSECLQRGALNGSTEPRTGEHGERPKLTCTRGVTRGDGDEVGKSSE